MCSYTSSVSTHTSCSSANAAIVASSSRVKTRPQGLDGLHSTKAFRPDSKARRSSSGSKR